MRRRTVGGTVIWCLHNEGEGWLHETSCERNADKCRRRGSWNLKKITHFLCTWFPREQRTVRSLYFHTAFLAVESKVPTCVIDILFIFILLGQQFYYLYHARIWGYCEISLAIRSQSLWQSMHSSRAETNLHSLGFMRGFEGTRSFLRSFPAFSSTQQQLVKDSLNFIWSVDRVIQFT